MPVEEITGVAFPGLNDPKDAGVFGHILAEIGECCSIQLNEAGYFKEGECAGVLSAYRSGLSAGCEPGNPSADFVAFTAETQAKAHGLSAELEVFRMQKLLRWALGDRVRCWTFGLLPGAVDGLYRQSETARVVCGYLACPSLLGGEVSIVHTTSVNPVAALVASAWIQQELTALGDGDAPFLFPLMVDLPSWLTTLQRHFGVK